MRTLKTAQHMQLPLGAMGQQGKHCLALARWCKWLQRYQRRVPVRLQLNAVECGAACLAMILSYYGRQTRVAECREGLGIGRDGVTAEMIAKAARAYGLRVKAYSIAALADFQYVQLPAIAHWNFEHFVVVERWTSRFVTIIDPGNGRRRLTMEQFNEGFTGVVLTFEPGVQFQQHRTKAPLVWRDYLLQHLLHTPGLLVQILSTSLLIQVLGLALPLLTKLLVDQVLPLSMTSVMPMLGLGMLLLVVTQLVTSYLRAALLIYLQARVDTRMMLGFFDHLLTLPYRFFEQRTVGDLLLRLGSNTVIRDTLTSQTLAMMLDSALVLSYLILLCLHAPSFGLMVCMVGLLQVMLLLGTTRRVHDLMQRDVCAQAESQSYVVEALTGILTLKACGGEEHAFDHWSNLFCKHLNVSLQRQHLGAMVEALMLALRTFSPLTLLWVGALHVLDGTMSLGTMLALNAIATAFFMPLSSLVSNGQRLQLVQAHLERLTDVLTAEPEQPLQGVHITPRLTGRMALHQVSFCYDPNAAPVLHEISLTIEPGQKIAFVGRSGSGKSTLAKLLLGLYLPTAGDILYDGLPLPILNWRTVRSQLGVVLQEPFLFSGSIRQNIAVHNPSLTFEQIQAAAQLAAIHEEIMHLPMGYETRIAEGGSGLSGGQRQRLALARALTHQPAVLFLDEATSHLDGATESVVEQNLRQLSCTRIVIAHRLSTICDADQIFVLHDGTIVEQGRHEELLEQQGYYAALVLTHRAPVLREG